MGVVRGIESRISKYSPEERWPIVKEILTSYPKSSFYEKMISNKEKSLKDAFLEEESKVYFKEDPTFEDVDIKFNSEKIDKISVDKDLKNYMASVDNLDTF